MFIRISTSFVMLLGLTVFVSAEVPVSDKQDIVTIVARANMESVVSPLSEPSPRQLGAREETATISIWGRYPDSPPEVQATHLPP
ncbi:hypothetical protein BDR04DRAFT_1087134 [Suillus decipiens]|nr:hypothetical protein BDR04DRAFT_1087134 [Suillus decipiens]